MSPDEKRPFIVRANEANREANRHLPADECEMSRKKMKVSHFLNCVNKQEAISCYLQLILFN